MSIPNYDARIADAPEPLDMAGCRDAWLDMARDQIGELASEIGACELYPSRGSPPVPPEMEETWCASIERLLKWHTPREKVAEIAQGYGLIPDYETFAQDWTERQAEDAFYARGER